MPITRLLTYSEPPRNCLLANCLGMEGSVGTQAVSEWYTIVYCIADPCISLNVFVSRMLLPREKMTHQQP